MIFAARCIESLGDENDVAAFQLDLLQAYGQIEFKNIRHLHIVGS